MFGKIIGSILCLLLVISCRTTKNQESTQISNWGSPEEKELAKQRFSKTLHECVPLVIAVVPGVKVLNIFGDSQREQVTQQFIDRLVQEPTEKAERSALLLQLYYGDKNLKLPPCGGEAAEFVLSEFAVHTNVIKVAFGEESLLQIID